MAAEPIDVQTALEMTKIGDAVIDVREPSEYAEAHIDGAVNIPIGALPGAKLPDGPLITTCASGRRAERAADLLCRPRPHRVLDRGRYAGVVWRATIPSSWAPNHPGACATDSARSAPWPASSRTRPNRSPKRSVDNVTAAAGTVAAKAETVTEKVVDRLKPKG